MTIYGPTPASAGGGGGVHALAGAEHTGELVDGQIPAAIARDAELHAQLHAALHAAGQSDALLLQDLGGAVTDGQIPDLQLLSGVLVDAQIPGTIARDTEIPTVSPFVVRRKTITESVANATVQNDDHLTFPIAANEIWSVLIAADVNIRAVSDFKCGLGVPAGALGEYIVTWDTTNEHGAEGSTLGNTTSILIAADQSRTSVLLYATVENGATPGDVVFKWAQVTTNATPVSVKQGSFLLAFKQA